MDQRRLDSTWAVKGAECHLDDEAAVEESTSCSSFVQTNFFYGDCAERPVRRWRAMSSVDPSLSPVSEQLVPEFVHQNMAPTHPGPAVAKPRWPCPASDHQVQPTGGQQKCGVPPTAHADTRHAGLGLNTTSNLEGLAAATTAIDGQHPAVVGPAGLCGPQPAVAGTLESFLVQLQSRKHRHDSLGSPHRAAKSVKPQVAVIGSGRLQQPDCQHTQAPTLNQLVLSGHMRAPQLLQAWRPPSSAAAFTAAPATSAGGRPLQPWSGRTAAVGAAGPFKCSAHCLPPGQQLQLAFLNAQQQLGIPAVCAAYPDDLEDTACSAPVKWQQ